MPIINRVSKVKVIVKNGENYSDTRYDIPANVSPDGGLIYIPENFIWEIKNKTDITGRIR